MRREWVGKRFASLTTQDGHTFTDVQVSRADAYSLSFMYADGGFRVPYSKLPEEWQKQLMYDATEANYATAQADHDRAMVDYQHAMEKYEAKKKAADAAFQATLHDAGSIKPVPASKPPNPHEELLAQKRAALYSMLNAFKDSKESDTKVTKRTSVSGTGKVHVSVTKTSKSLPSVSAWRPEDWPALPQAGASARKLAAEINALK